MKFTTMYMKLANAQTPLLLIELWKIIITF